MPDYSDKKTERKIRGIINALGLCGCGTEDKYALIRDMLERAESGGSFYEPMGIFNARTVEFIADVMSSNQWDLLEHGTGIGSSWLTEKGAVLLQFFRDKGVDTDKWPDWWCSCGPGETF